MTAAQAMTGTERPPRPIHHLPEDLLIAYAAGSLDEALSLIVATHLTYCPICRRHAHELEEVGGTFLDRIEPVHLSDDAAGKMLAALEGSSLEEGHGTKLSDELSTGKPGILPAPLRGYVGGDTDHARWTGLGLGIEKSEITLADPSRRAFLMKVPAGRSIPMHTHDGTEMVLVLRGAYCVDGNRFGPGDLSISDGAVTHSPETEEREDCICLVVVDGPIRLTGFVGAILNRFVSV